MNEKENKMDLKILYPEIAKEWDYEKNYPLTPEQFSCGSKKKVWWKCSNDDKHSYCSMIYNRTKKHTKCPICANQLIVEGINDLFTTNPELKEFWDYEKNDNIGLFPEKVSKGSGKNAFWKCKKNHSYNQRISHKVNGIGCPICANQLIVEGINDLFTTNPELKKEWDYEKNGKINLNPQKISKGAEKKAWWICSKCGNNWEAYIYSRTAGTGCPKCSIIISNENAIKRRIIETGSLSDNNPELSKEWNYEKNGMLTPNDVTVSSNKKVWWICKKGHEWMATVNTRNSGNGCPECSKELFTSFPEQAIYFYLKQKFNDTKNRYKLNGKTEIDIYIPSIKIGIEYDGYRYHKNKREHDLNKTKIIESSGINLIHIIECIKLEDLKPDSEKNIYCLYKTNYLFLNDVVKKIINIINNKIKMNLDFNIDILKDMYKIQEQYIQTEKENSIISKKPDLKEEWDYEKNGRIKPEFVNFGTRRKYWWICKIGHSFDCSPSNRFHGYGCPYCSGRKVIVGENDLQTKYPEIAKEFDLEKNYPLTPKDITSNNGKILWWKCKECGYSYQSTPNNRVKGTKCTICSNHTIVKGYNDLFTTNPELKEEWNFKLNNELSIDPYQLSKGSNKKVWWKCDKCGYEWKTTVVNRTNKNATNCPICAKQKLGKYKNRAIAQFDLNGKFIKEYKSITEATEATKILNISACCRKLRKSSGGYIWKYKDEIDE